MTKAYVLPLVLSENEATVQLCHNFFPHSSNSLIPMFLSFDARYSEILAVTMN
jgi:hypothetical protein